jgi:hypothetical protein
MIKLAFRLSKARNSFPSMATATLPEVLAEATDCRIYGISAWSPKLSEGTKQQGLIITPEEEPAITVDDLEVAQLGSANFSTSGENAQDNDLIVIRDPGAAAKFEVHFERMWDAPCRWTNSSRRLRRSSPNETKTLRR